MISSRTEHRPSSSRTSVKNAPEGFSSYPVKSLPPKQPGTLEVARLGLKTDMTATKRPVSLSVVGRATIDGRDVTAEPADSERYRIAFGDLPRDMWLLFSTPAEIEDPFPR